MKVTVLSVGKIRDPFLERMIAAYMSRMSPNHKVAWESVPEVRGETRKEVVLEKEGLLLEKFFRERDRCVLLDESGDHFKSTEFASWIQNETTMCPARPLCFDSYGTALSRVFDPCRNSISSLNESLLFEGENP